MPATLAMVGSVGGESIGTSNFEGMDMLKFEQSERYFLDP